MSTFLENDPGDRDHSIWVREVMNELSTIAPGMTRRQLMALVKEEGGLSGPSYQSFVGRRCRYFRIDVTFEPVTGGLVGEELSEMWREGWHNEFGERCLYSPEDVITKVSRMGLGYPNLD